MLLGNILKQLLIVVFVNKSKAVDKSVFQKVINWLNSLKGCEHWLC